MGKRAIIMAGGTGGRVPRDSGAGARSPWLEHSLAGGCRGTENPAVSKPVLT